MSKGCRWRMRSTSYTRANHSSHDHATPVRRVTALNASHYTNISGRSSLTSKITSAGMFNRHSASQIISTLGASYKQSVFLLSKLRKENSH
jgi:hypothetical protein